MPISSSHRRGRWVLPTLLALAALAAPSSASAQATVEERNEESLTAFFEGETRDCGGFESSDLITVLAGRESETGSEEETFLTVTVQDACTFARSRASFEPTSFTFSPSLKTASVAGTGTFTSGPLVGEEVSVDLTWTGTGEIRRTNRTSNRPGRVNHFRRAVRDAVATGSVVVDGENLTPDPSVSAQMNQESDHTIETPNEPPEEEF